MLKLGTIDEIKSSISEGRGFTKSNLFYVKFPTIQGVTAYDVGLLTTDVGLPTRQLASIDRDVGVDKQPVVYGYTNPSVQMVFRILNNQKVRNYFEAWQQYILPQYADGESRYEARFPDRYVQPIHIYQLERGKSFPLFNKNIDKRIGPININLDLDVDVTTAPVANYHWVLDRAYPISQTASNLSDGEGEISTLTIDFAYKSWRGRAVTPGKEDASIQFGGGINISI